MNMRFASLCAFLLTSYESYSLCLQTYKLSSLSDYAYPISKDKHESHLDGYGIAFNSACKHIQQIIPEIPHEIWKNVIFSYLMRKKKNLLEFGIMKSLPANSHSTNHVTIDGRLITISEPGIWESIPTLSTDQERPFSVTIPLPVNKKFFFEAVISDYGSSLVSLATKVEDDNARPIKTAALDRSGTVLATTKTLCHPTRSILFLDEITVIIVNQQKKRLEKYNLRDLEVPLNVYQFDNNFFKNLQKMKRLDDTVGILEIQKKNANNILNIKFSLDTLEPIESMTAPNPVKDPYYKTFHAQGTSMLHVHEDLFFTQYVSIALPGTPIFPCLTTASMLPIYCNKRTFNPTELIIYPSSMMRSSYIHFRDKLYACIDKTGMVYIGDTQHKSLYQAFNGIAACSPGGIPRGYVELHANGALVRTDLGVVVLNYSTMLDIDCSSKANPRLYALYLRSLLKKRVDNYRQ